jgi:hypothetical protein
MKGLKIFWKEEVQKNGLLGHERWENQIREVKCLQTISMQMKGLKIFFLKEVKGPEKWVTEAWKVWKQI